MTNDEFLQSCYKVKALADSAASFSHILPKREFEQLFNKNKETLVSLMPELFHPLVQNALWKNIMIILSLDDSYKKYKRKTGINQNKNEITILKAI